MVSDSQRTGTDVIKLPIALLLGPVLGGRPVPLREEQLPDWRPPRDSPAAWPWPWQTLLRKERLIGAVGVVSAILHPCSSQWLLLEGCARRLHLSVPTWMRTG